MQRDSTNGTRPDGTGSLLRHRHRSGAETWYGKWRIDGRQVMRVLGPARYVDGSAGLTAMEAEATLRAAIEATKMVQPASDVVNLADAGRRYITNRELLGVKAGTLSDYESYLRVHLVPFFGERCLDEIDVDAVESFIATKRAEGKAIKSIRNYLGLLGAIFALALKRGWCTANPIALIDKPRDQHDHDIRYLNGGELEDLLRATPDTELGRLERALYLTAAMTGLRRGELLALRWQDVDFDAGVIRVRRTYSRGEFGTPGRLRALGPRSSTCSRHAWSRQPRYAQSSGRSTGRASMSLDR
jgi:integrase